VSDGAGSAQDQARLDPGGRVHLAQGEGGLRRAIAGGAVTATAVKSIVAVAAALLLYFLWRSLGWPLIHDAALMHYIAWLISQGAVPYRDTFDMNMPGVYLIHLAVLTIGGAGDATFRAFDLGWLGATAVLIYGYCRPLGNRWSASLAALLFAIQHVSGGASLAGQRDFLLCVFLVAAAYAVARSCETGGRFVPLAWAGLIAGCAVMVKPLAALFLLGAALAAAVTAHRARRSGLGAALTVLGAGCVVPVLMLGWLAWLGGLGAFFWTLTEWTAPFYSQVSAARPSRALVTVKWGLIGAAALLGAVRPGPQPYDVRRWLAIGGVVYGFLHFLLQFKGYDYHLYPLACFLCMLAGLAVAPDARAPRRWPARLRASAGGLPVAAVLAIALVVMAARGVERVNQPWEAQRAQRVDAVVADLRKLLGPGDTIQVLGPPGGHVLLRLGLRQPTRFFTDFQFFVWSSDPRIRSLRAEFTAGLEASPPAAILAFPGRGAAGPYGRLADFWALAELLARAYAIEVEGNGYRIYAKRAGP
jgi:Dolichyl-phosphate-mannose-protein mannosyltransferase